MAKITAKSYKDALMVQDACNLSGVVHSFARLMTDMIADGMDNPTRDNHPITILYVDKICHLTGMQTFMEGVSEKITKAYDVCETKSKEVL